MVAKVSELITDRGETFEKLLAAPRMTVLAGKGGRITDTQPDGTSVSADIAWPEAGADGPATFTVALRSGAKVLTRSKFAFELPGVSGSMAESQSPQESGALAEARRVILPRFKVEEATFAEALRELMAHDERRLLMGAIQRTADERRDLRITLDLENVTFADAVEQLARSANCRLDEVGDGITTPKSLMLMSKTFESVRPVKR